MKRLAEGAFHLLGLALYSLVVLLHCTCRFTYEGLQYVIKSEPVILCYWHQHSIAYFTTFIRHDRAHAWMSDSSWRMRPIHVGMRAAGIKRIVMGSSSHDGIAAAKELVGYLRAGYSTGISPDGPAGPPRVIRKGVLHLAVASGVPIVPVSFRASRRCVLPSWDRKWIPLPFALVTVTYHEPIFVESAHIDEALDHLRESLNLCVSAWGNEEHYSLRWHRGYWVSDVWQEW